MEIYELVDATQPQLAKQILQLLIQIKGNRPDLVELIEEGVRLIAVPKSRKIGDNS